jgi:hypothetical protein
VGKAPVSTAPGMARKEGENAAAEAPRPSASLSWVRPVAAVLLALSAVGSFWLLTRYLRLHDSIVAAPDTPLIAATIVLAVVAVMALAVLVFRPERGHLMALVATSLAWSIALLIALTLAWAAIARSERQDRWHGTPVANMAETDAYLTRHLPAGLNPIRIPTGVNIQSLEFLTGDNVQVTGYIWQRFGPDVPDDIDRGVVLAEGVKEAYDAKEAYRFEEDGVETIGWYFAATLRQPFEYAEYPFDEQDLWVRIWPRDFSRDIVLVPDFASYNTMHPTSMPGIESEFVYSGWSPIYSGFSLSEEQYDSSYGIGVAGQYPELPDLYFNLVLDRNFAGPFFEYFVFAIAVAFLLFGLLALTTDDENLKARFQLTTAQVLVAASGLLFAVILKHNQLRSGVDAQGFSYIEVLPIMLYGVIVVVVLNAILVASPFNVKFIAHRNNLVPVLAYWPALLGLLLAVTLIVFFRA